MCLFVKANCKPEIATEDILCYKLVLSNPGGWTGWFYYSKTIFQWNIPVIAENDLNNPIEHLEIDQTEMINYGFHANLIKHCTRHEHYCIIPAGSEYCYGMFNEIVSTQIIVFRGRIDYWLYILMKKLNRNK